MALQTYYFPYTGEMRYWTAPVDGAYRITAQGGGYFHHGTRMSGTVTLSARMTLQLAVGGMAASYYGGSGGTFIGILNPLETHEHNTYGVRISPLLVAGGGGGRGYYVGDGSANLGEDGGAGSYGGAGGTNGRGGAAGHGKGGGGFYTDGGGNLNSAFVNGAGGATFGGGGLQGSSSTGGGGGGYGGGGGGAEGRGGGGGGSYNRLEDVDNLAAVGTSDGWAKIELVMMIEKPTAVYSVAKFKPRLNIEPYGAGVKVKWNKVV